MYGLGADQISLKLELGGTIKLGCLGFIFLPPYRRIFITGHMDMYFF